MIDHTPEQASRDAEHRFEEARRIYASMRSIEGLTTGELEPRARELLDVFSAFAQLNGKLGIQPGNGLTYDDPIDTANKLLDGLLPDSSNDVEDELPHDESSCWVPFPTDALPQPCATFVDSAARALACDEAYVALPLLSTLAACVGNARYIRIKAGWCKPPNTWSITLGDSGTNKTAAARSVVGPLKRQETDAIRHFEAEMKEYEERYKEWESARVKSHADRPQEPKPCARLITDDCNTEAVRDLLTENARGLLVARDELAGFMKSFDAYRNGKGGDAQTWLELYDGGEKIFDRTGGRSYAIRNASVSITGGMQPAVLRRLLRGEFWSNGIVPRFLVAMPPYHVSKWTDATIPHDVESALARLYRALRQLAPQVDHSGRYTPMVLDLTQDARGLFVEHFNAQRQLQADASSGAVRSALAKLEEYAARFALVFHLVDCHRDGRGEGPIPISADAMERGIAVSRFFNHEHARVYSYLQQGIAADERDKVVAAIRRSKHYQEHGCVTARNFQRTNSKKYAKRSHAERELDKLCEHGLACRRDWQNPNGGPRTKAYFLRNGAGG